MQVSAQQYTYAQTDSLSYVYFSSFKSRELKELGQKALKQKIDFYFLRVRLGITYFREHNFELASVHFTRAIEMNPSEDYVLIYTYQSYLKSAQFDRANQLLYKYPQIAPETKAREKGLSTWELEAGIVTSPNTKNYEGKELRTPGTNWAEGNFFSGMQYARAYAELMLNPGLKCHLGAGIFNTSQLSKIQFFNTNLEETYHTLNLQLNAGLTKTFEHGLSSGLGLAYFRQNFTYPTLSSNMPLPPPNSEVVDTSEISNTIAISAYVAKRLKFMEPVLFFNYGNFDNESRFQTELGLTYFPFGNSNFYGFSSLSYINTSGTATYAYRQKIGATLGPKVLAEFSYTGGSLDNYMAHMGFLTLNTFDPINWSTGIDLSYKHKQAIFSLGYRYQKRTGTYDYERSPGNVEAKEFTYNNHLLFTSIKFLL